MLPGFDAVYQINKCSSIFLLLSILVVKNNFHVWPSKLNNKQTHIKKNCRHYLMWAIPPKLQTPSIKYCITCNPNVRTWHIVDHHPAILIAIKQPVATGRFWPSTARQLLIKKLVELVFVQRSVSTQTSHSTQTSEWRFTIGKLTISFLEQFLYRPKRRFLNYGKRRASGVDFRNWILWTL